ncbi:ATP-binding protein [Rhodococcus sp. ARC_M6]|uniref:ATP-binding protein n=1 Tax=Rhodococcus sp. ARC_M6 TaxID=2928852 RepID=UPI001FB45207|nr:ATP-binding protein [Rhodococcus sp. ARC_M6]MCJ0907212.1 ATP-binding protein [Rhodococcus sp. ARC_M6]
MKRRCGDGRNGFTQGDRALRPGVEGARIRESAARLAEQARSDGWSHEDYLAAVLSREVTARESSGSQTRIRSAGFPTRKSLEEFNFDYQPSLSREMVAHSGTGVFLTQARNVVLLGPPGTGKTHLAIGLGIKAAQSGHRVAFATAVDWVGKLKAAHSAGKLPAELVKLRRIGLIIVDDLLSQEFDGVLVS